MLAEIITVGSENIKLDFIFAETESSDKAIEDNQSLLSHTYVYRPPANQQEDLQENADPLSKLISLICPATTVLLLTATLMLYYKPQHMW